MIVSSKRPDGLYRLLMLACVYVVGVVGILGSGARPGPTTSQASCPPGIDETKPHSVIRLVGVTPPITLPQQAGVTIDRHQKQTSSRLGSSCSTSGSSRYLPKGNIVIVDRELQFGFGFSALDLTSYDPTTKDTSSPLGLNVIVRNGSGRGVNIDWNAVSIIGPTGKAYGIIHRGAKMADRTAVMAPSTVPPGAILEDFVYPRDVVSFSGGRYGSGWTGVNFFEAMKPEQQFKLYLPIKHGTDTVEYQFVFEVNQPAQS